MALDSSARTTSRPDLLSRRFEVRQILGSGGFGVVHEAHDRERDEVVAPRVLRRFDAEALNRLEREFRSLLMRVHVIRNTEVTLGEFDTLMTWKPSLCYPEHPVNAVSWFDALACANERSDLDEQAWYCGHGPGYAPAGSLPPDPAGLHDRSGNVWEWCDDRWDGSGYPGDATDPWQHTGPERVMRGGSDVTLPWAARVAHREGDAPGDRTSHLGFRLVRTLP